MFAIRLNENLRLLGLESTFLWMYQHPTLTKVMRVAGLILGGAILGSIAWEFPLLRMREIVGRLLIGSLVVLVTLVSAIFLDLFIPSPRNVKPHVYKTGACEGSRLEYRGSIPLLILQTDDPFRMGRAHGKLCGEAIDQLLKRLHATLPPKKLEELPPPHLLSEMKGIVSGYEEWARAQFWWKFPMRLTLEDLRLLHAKLEQIRPTCSATIDRDPDRKGTVFSLNLATSTFGILETYGLLISREQNPRFRSLGVALPGSIGLFAGMNQEGLSVADSPSLLWNRMYLDNFASIRAIQYGDPLIAADPWQGLAGLSYWRIYEPLVANPTLPKGEEIVFRLNLMPSTRTLLIARGNPVSPLERISL